MNPFFRMNPMFQMIQQINAIKQNPSQDGGQNVAGKVKGCQSFLVHDGVLGAG